MEPRGLLPEHGVGLSRQQRQDLVDQFIGSLPGVGGIRPKLVKGEVSSPLALGGCQGPLHDLDQLLEAMPSRLAGELADVAREISPGKPFPLPGLGAILYELNQGAKVRLHLGAIAISLKVASPLCGLLSNPVRIGVAPQGPAETVNLKLEGPSAVVDVVPEISELFGGCDLGLPGPKIVRSVLENQADEIATDQVVDLLTGFLEPLDQQASDGSNPGRCFFEVWMVHDKLGIEIFGREARVC